MRRRVIQIGDSTQLISLPRKWAKLYNIKKGQELEIEEEGDKLIVRTNSTPKLNEIEIDVTNLDRSSILHALRNIYRRGYDSICVKFNQQLTNHYRIGKEKKMISIIHDEVNRLPGLEIIQQKENFCIIKGVSDISDKEFDNVLRRIFILLTDMSSDLLNGIKNADPVLVETIEEKHFSVTKFISYCLRSLNKKGYPESSKLPMLYHIISNIWIISGAIKYCARQYLRYNKKMKKESVQFLEMIDKQINLYYDLFYKFDLKKVRELSENKEKIKTELDTLPAKKIPYDELIIIHKLSDCLEPILDITGARIALEY